MTLGRTSDNKIKIKTDEAGGGLRAVSCGCCGAGLCGTNRPQYATLVENVFTPLPPYEKYVLQSIEPAPFGGSRSNSNSFINYCEVIDAGLWANATYDASWAVNSYPEKLNNEIGWRINLFIEYFGSHLFLENYVIEGDCYAYLYQGNASGNIWVPQIQLVGAHTITTGNFKELWLGESISNFGEYCSFERSLPEMTFTVVYA